MKPDPEQTIPQPGNVFEDSVVLSSFTFESSDRSMQVCICRNINEVSPAKWDSLLTSDDLQQSHRFIRLCQESGVENAEYWHLMLYQAERLCGVATLTRVAVRLDLLSAGFSRSLLSSLRKCSPGLLEIPVLFCGLPVSFGQPCLKVAPWADTPAVGRVVAEVMDRIAGVAGVTLLCLKEFDSSQADALASLCDHGFLCATSLPSCSLPIVWTSFSSYLEAMTANYRRQVRATLSAGRAAGLKVRHLNAFSEEGDAIFALYEHVIRRAKFRLETLNRQFLDRLDTNLGDQSRAIFLERHGRPLAVAILLHTPDAATFLLAGLDYEANRQWQVYPNLVLEVVAEAIRARAARLEMGQTSYALKSRLGAVESPRFLFLRHRNRL
jgi:hypothetical protein